MGIMCSWFSQSKPLPQAPQKPVIECSNDHNPVTTSAFSCEGHVLCISCQLKSYSKSMCVFCRRFLNPEEKFLIENLFFKPCPHEYTVGPLPSTVLCGCFLCPNCQKTSRANSSNECEHCPKKPLNPTEQDPKEEISCPICGSKTQRENTRTLECNHLSCCACLTSYLEFMITGSKLDIQKQGGIKCFDSCNFLVSPNIIAKILPEHLISRLNIIMLGDIIECPRCKKEFSSEITKIHCPFCSYNFCTNCMRKIAECTCKADTVYELGEIDMELACCPGCKTPYLKDQKCDHVDCANPQCFVSFCFSCSAYRSPTLAHGCHYHRPDCRFYRDCSEIDKYEPSCILCRKNNGLCARPKKLRVARKFDPGEY